MSEPLSLGELHKRTAELQEALAVANARSSDELTKRRAGRAELLLRVATLLLETDKVGDKSKYVKSKINNALGEFGFDLIDTPPHGVII